MGCQSLQRLVVRMVNDGMDFPTVSDQFSYQDAADVTTSSPYYISALFIVSVPRVLLASDKIIVLQVKSLQNYCIMISTFCQYIANIF
jgi:hypothetical protein